MKNAITAMLLLGTTAAAPGAISWFPAQNIAIPNTFEGVSVDLETGDVSTTLQGLPGGDANFLFGGQEVSNDADETAASPSWQPVRSGTANTDALRNLGIGTTVDSSSTVASGFGGSGSPNSHFPEFTPGVPGNIGFSLETPSGKRFGWMRVTLQDNNQPGGTIHAWAIEDSGDPIVVGAIPEPGSILLSSLGLGTLLFRRRRQA
ncbi:MAG: hypothetical protein CMP28_08240 [Roseibacillus sp.]|nr:hypothetical protein [Roseibacillus sp.]